jgi:chorismate mutase / prephenate dehydratase
LLFGINLYLDRPVRHTISMSSRHALHHAKAPSVAKKIFSGKSDTDTGADARLPWSYRQTPAVRLLICVLAAIVTGVCGTLVHRLGAQYNVPVGLVLALVILVIATWGARARNGTVGVAIQMILSTLVAGFFANFNGDILVPVGFRTSALPFFSQYVGLFWLGGLIVVPIVCILLPSSWFVIPENLTSSTKRNMDTVERFDNADKFVKPVAPVGSTVPVASETSQHPVASTTFPNHVAQIAPVVLGSVAPSASPSSAEQATPVEPVPTLASAGHNAPVTPVVSAEPATSVASVDAAMSVAPAVSDESVESVESATSVAPVASGASAASAVSSTPVSPIASAVPVASIETVEAGMQHASAESVPQAAPVESVEHVTPVEMDIESDPVGSVTSKASHSLIERAAATASAASAGLVGPVVSVPAITPVATAESDTLTELVASTAHSASDTPAKPTKTDENQDMASSTSTASADTDNLGIRVPNLAGEGFAALKNTDTGVGVNNNSAKIDGSRKQPAHKIITDEINVVEDVAVDMQTSSADTRTLLFLGPQGSFTHQAAVSAANGLTEQGITVHLEPRDNVQAIIRDVEAGRGWGVIAWENGIEGSVVSNLDAMIDARDVAGLGRLSIDVSFDAFVRADEGSSTTLSPYVTLNQVVAHPHGLAQCAKFVQEHQLTPVPATSNAAACRDILPGQVALGPSLCGPLYGLKTLEHKVQDFDGTNTDFLIVAAREDVNQVLKSSRQIGVSDYETIIAVAPLSTGPGVMAKLLDRLRDEGLNMTSLMSRPIKGNAGTYSFIITLDAAPWQRGLKHFLSQLVAEGDWVKTLAVYLRRDRSNPPVGTWMLPQGGICSNRSKQNESRVDAEKELLW